MSRLASRRAALRGQLRRIFPTVRFRRKGRVVAFPGGGPRRNLDSFRKGAGGEGAGRAPPRYTNHPLLAEAASVTARDPGNAKTSAGGPWASRAQLHACAEEVLSHPLIPSLTQADGPPPFLPAPGTASASLHPCVVGEPEAAGAPAWASMRSPMGNCILGGIKRHGARGAGGRDSCALRGFAPAAKAGLPCNMLARVEGYSRHLSIL